MKKLLSRSCMFLLCLALLVSLTGCLNNDELIVNSTNRLSNTYWKWIDTSPTADSIRAYYYACIKEDGTLEEVSYTHEYSKVIQKNTDEFKCTWEVIVHKSKPCVKIYKDINGYYNSGYYLADVDKDGNIERLSCCMYLPGDKYYSVDKVYVMTELSQDEYKSAIEDEERALQNYISNNNNEKPNNDKSSSFTNKYGTKTTKCAHAGCNRYIASSGDTNCCTQHSRRCLECNKYIDEDAMYCMSCISSALGN